MSLYRASFVPNGVDPTGELFLQRPDHIMDDKLGIGPGGSNNRGCEPSCIDAVIASENKKFKGVKNDHYKHCKMSCELLKKCGGFASWTAGWGKEVIDVFGSGDADWGDTVANRYGRGIGAKGGDCAIGCGKKYPPDKTRNPNPGWF